MLLAAVVHDSPYLPGPRAPKETRQTLWYEARRKAPIRTGFTGIGSCDDFITRGLRQKMHPGQVARIVGHESLAMIYSQYNQMTASDAARALMAAIREEE